MNTSVRTFLGMGWDANGQECKEYWEDGKIVREWSNGVTEILFFNVPRPATSEYLVPIIYKRPARS